jgi:TetR/AcrR family transcriptional regulator
MVIKRKDQPTEEKIIAAARKVFVIKGLSGARMQDIADEAGINKALLHYYFRSKEKLFDMIFMEAAQKLFPKINFIFESNMPLFEKIHHFADEYITVMVQNPYLPLFVLNEINQDPASFFKKLNEKFGFPDPSLFLKQIEKEIKKGKIKPVNPVQLFMNMLSLCIFPFMARPMFQLRMGFGETQFREFMEQRKKEVPKFIIDSIKR